jgi:hypothetical protein
MEPNIIYFNNIKYEAKILNILFRMGFKNRITKIKKIQRKYYDDLINKAKKICNLKGAYTILDIIKNKNNKIVINNNIIIKSKNLSKLLEKSDKIVFMASTVGNDIVKLRDENIKGKDPAFGVILDAVASETADAGLDWIQQFISRQIAKQGLKLTRRFSPGYGDLHISIQKTIYKKLKLNKIGIKITKNYFLIPEKSVLAIAGIIKKEN